jgi:hypothetical protein
MYLSVCRAAALLDVTQSKGKLVSGGGREHLPSRGGRGGGSTLSPVTASAGVVPVGISNGRTLDTRGGTALTSPISLVGEAAIDGAGTGLLSTRQLLLFLLLLGFRVAVEVQIDDDVPVDLAVDESAAKTQDFTGKHPPDETDGVTTLVVGGNGNVDELGGGVGVAESDNGDVDIGSLLDGLGVGARVGHDYEAGFLERAGDVVGEVTGGEATGDGDGTGVSRELEHGTLAIGAGGDHTDVGGVVDGGDDTGSEDDLLPVALLELVKRNVVCTYQVLDRLITLMPSGRVFHK